MKRLEKIKLSGLSEVLNCINREEAHMIKGGGDVFFSAITYAPSYGIPDGGFCDGYLVSVSSVLRDNNQLWVGVNVSENGLSYAGKVSLFVDGSCVNQQNLQEPEGAVIVQQGFSPIGNLSFNLSQYSSASDIYFVVETYQSYNSGYGYAMNWLGASSTTIEVK